jgi:hypothetical protein
MKAFKIKLRKESFYINNSRSVIGDICFSVDDWCFPDKNWDDFVAALVYWLTHITTELASRKKEVVEMGFMEGCFKISITLEGENQCKIKFIEGEKLAGDEEIIHKTIITPFEGLKTEVKNACETLIQMKESKELDFEKDYENLKTSYDLLCEL